MVMQKYSNVNILRVSTFRVLLCVCVIALSAMACFAEPLPPDAYERLTEILKSSEFQNSQQAPSIGDEIMKDMKIWALDKIITLLKSAENLIRNSPKFFGYQIDWLFVWLKEMWPFVKFVLAASVIIFCVLLFAYVVKKLALLIQIWVAKNIKSSNPLSQEIQVNEVDHESVHGLLAEKQFIRALTVVRRRLRKIICDRYGAPLSLTDRELMRYMQSHSASESASEEGEGKNILLKELFSNIAQQFESCIYAHNSPQESVIAQMCLSVETQKAHHTT